MKDQKLVLVTGVSGYIASHIVKILLQRNYKIRGTVRSLSQQYKYQKLFQLFKDKKNNLEIVEGDLTNDEQWDSIVKGCDYVIHVASPVFSKTPKDQNQILKAAVQGTTSVLEACAKYKIQKVVVTSSIAAIYHQANSQKFYFGEHDFSDDDCPNLYAKSKVLAEKKAWQLAKKYDLNLSVINPGLVIGEYLLDNETTTNLFIKKMFNSKLMCKAYIPLVSVTDVALAHVNAMEKKQISKNKRYILVENTYCIYDIIKILQEEFSQYGYDLSKLNINEGLVDILALFSNYFFQLKRKKYRVVFDNKRAINELDIQFQQLRSYLCETAYSAMLKNWIPNLVNNQILQCQIILVQVWLLCQKIQKRIILTSQEIIQKTIDLIQQIIGIVKQKITKIKDIQHQIILVQYKILHGKIQIYQQINLKNKNLQQAHQINQNLFQNI